MTANTCKVIKHDARTMIETTNDIDKSIRVLQDMAKQGQTEIIQKAIIDIISDNKSKSDYASIIDDVKQKVDIINKLTRINK